MQDAETNFSFVNVENSRPYFHADFGCQAGLFSYGVLRVYRLVFSEPFAENQSLRVFWEVNPIITGLEQSCHGKIFTLTRNFSHVTTNLFVSEFTNHNYLFSMYRKEKSWPNVQDRGFQMFMKPVSWVSATLLCKELGGTLPTLWDMAQHLELIRALHKTCIQLTEVLFIGLHLTNKVIKAKFSS